MRKCFKIIFILFLFILSLNNNVIADESNIQIKITPNSSEWTTGNIILIIDISSLSGVEKNSAQSVQILQGKETDSNKWIELGNGSNGVALNRQYNYVIKNNGKVSVRIMSWLKEDKSDIKQIAIQTYEVSNIDKTKPIIEKVDVTPGEKKITLNVVAKDSDSGISKYTVKCNETSETKTSENSKFEFNNLENGKKYNFVIIVEDKLGNKETFNKEISTVSTINQNDQNALDSSANGNPQGTHSSDTTVANKSIPQVGDRGWIIVVELIIISIVIYIRTKDRN